MDTQSYRYDDRIYLSGQPGRVEGIYLSPDIVSFVYQRAPSMSKSGVWSCTALGCVLMNTNEGVEMHARQE